MSRQILAAVLLVVIILSASSARAVSRNWTAGGSGSWQDNGNWDGAGVPDYTAVGPDDFALSTAGDHADIVDGQTFGAPLVINSNTTLDASASTTTVASDLTLAGGTLFSSPGGNGLVRTLAGAVSVTSASTIQLNSTNHRFTLSSTITGGSGLQLLANAFPGTKNRLTLTADNSGFSGGWTVASDGTLRPAVANALGSGITNVNSTGVIDLGADTTTTINVNSGGQAQVDTGSGAGSATIDVSDLRLEGGKLFSTPGGNGRTRNLTGTVFINEDTLIGVSSTNHKFTLTAALNGSNSITTGGEAVGFGGQQLILPTDNTGTFSGDWTINPHDITNSGTNFTVRLTNAGGFGTGAVQVNTNVDGSAVISVDSGLTVTNDISGTGVVQVDGAGVGTLTFADNTVSPGSSIGTLSFGDTTGNDDFVLGSLGMPTVLKMELGIAGNADLIAVDGDLTLDNVELELLDVGGNLAGSYIIATITGTQSGTFSNDIGGVVSGVNSDGLTYTANILYDQIGGQIVLSNVDISLNLVPEPSSLSLLAAGALIAIARRRRRKHNSCVDQ